MPKDQKTEDEAEDDDDETPKSPAPKSPQPAPTDKGNQQPKSGMMLTCIYISNIFVTV